MNINSITNQITLTTGAPQAGFRHDPAAAVPAMPPQIAAQSNRPRFDTLELSGLNIPMASEMLTPLEDCPVTLPGIFGPAKESTQFTSEDVSQTARWLSSLMDENGDDIRSRISFGMSEAQLAEHFGTIGKQIDAAFSAGQISQQEYGDLNLGLEKYTEAMSAKSEQTAAMWEVGKQVASATRQMIESGASKEEMADHAESVRENMQAQISKFVEDFCSIDRSLLNSLITRVRGGESLFPEGTVHTYARENTAGYFKNGFVPFVPVEYL